MARKKDDRVLRYGEGSVLERNGRYQVRWRDGDKLRAKTLASQDEAEDFLRQIARDKRDGIYASPSELTVAALIDESLGRFASRLSTRTILTYRNRADMMIVPHLGKRRVAELAPIDVQRWIDKLVTHGYGASTIHAAMAVLFSVLREARVLGIIERNPAEGVRRPGITRKQITTWTEAEVRKVLAAVKADARYGALYHVALFAGLRPGELRALQWKDLDFDKNLMLIRRTITRGVDGSEMIGSQTKTHKMRAVAFSDDLAKVLLRHQEGQAERRKLATAWEDNDLVFDRGDGHWIYQSSWQSFHKDLCARAGVAQIRAHDLRHTSASLELAVGTHPKIVADRLGHSSIEITLDLYSHVSADLQRSAADALSRRLYVDDEPSQDATT